MLKYQSKEPKNHAKSGNMTSSKETNRASKTDPKDMEIYELEDKISE